MRRLLLKTVLLGTLTLVGCTNDFIQPNGTYSGTSNNIQAEYTTHFETNGGTKVDDMKGTISFAPVTTKANYTFVSWCKDQSLYQAVSFPFTPTENTTLYAKWTETTYPVSEITLSKTNGCVYPGINLVLTATISPSNATDTNLIWTSSNPNVASVSNGTVVYSGNGSTVIRATSSNGVSAECMVRAGELARLGMATSGYLTRDDGVQGYYSNLNVRLSNAYNDNAYVYISWNFIQTTGQVSKGGLYIVATNSSGNTYFEKWYQFGMLEPNKTISCGWDVPLKTNDFYTLVIGTNGKWFTY